MAHSPQAYNGIVDHLQPHRPIYRETAAIGHFGRVGDSFTREKTDKTEALRRAAKSYTLAAVGR